MDINPLSDVATNMFSHSVVTKTKAEQEGKMGGQFLTLASQLELLSERLNNFFYCINDSLNSFGSDDKGHFLQFKSWVVLGD